MLTALHCDGEQYAVGWLYFWSGVVAEKRETRAQCTVGIMFTGMKTTYFWPEIRCSRTIRRNGHSDSSFLTPHLRTSALVLRSHFFSFVGNNNTRLDG